jgi:hypothetical protein
VPSAASARYMKIKTVVRYSLVLVGGFFTGSRLVDALDNWREWHQWAVADPSGADFYRSNFWIDVAIAALTLGITGLVYWLLRPRPNVQGSRNHESQSNG